MIRRIRRKLITRLALVALALAILSGAVVLYFEMKEIEEHVLQLALEEAHSLSYQISFLTLDNPSDFAKARDQVADQIYAEHLSGRNFIVIEMYDRDRKKVISVSDPEYARVEDAIVRSGHDIKLSGQTQHRKFFLDGLLYIEVSSPITLAAGEIAA
jgi:hypothetical protein